MALFEIHTTPLERPWAAHEGADHPGQHCRQQWWQGGDSESGQRCSRRQRRAVQRTRHHARNMATEL